MYADEAECTAKYGDVFLHNRVDFYEYAYVNIMKSC